MRDWAGARSERTRHLIELGGLAQTASLVELSDNDGATPLGGGPSLTWPTGSMVPATTTLSPAGGAAACMPFDADRDAATGEGKIPGTTR